MKRHHHRSAWKYISHQAKRAANYRCQRCGRMGPLETHHKRPINRGGDDSPANLEVLCKRCHIEHHHPAPSTEALRWKEHMRARSI